MIKFLYLNIIIGCLLSLCSCKDDKSKVEVVNGNMDNEGVGFPYKKSISDLKSEERMFLVEGAVDLWFFYHLHDYKSYEPLIRSTDFNTEGDYYLHKCRYRASTLEGGYETEEKLFKVSLQIDSIGLKDYHVEDITGHKSLTEKEE